MAHRRIDEIVRRIEREYRALPGLRLTAEQARRLWTLDEQVCDALLGALVDLKFLARTVDGAFVRDGRWRTLTNQKQSVGNA